MIIEKEIKVDTFIQLLQVLNPKRIYIGLENFKEPTESQLRDWKVRKSDLLNGIILTLPDTEIVKITELYKLPLGEHSYTFIDKETDRYGIPDTLDGLALTISMYNEFNIVRLPAGYHVKSIFGLTTDMCKIQTL